MGRAIVTACYRELGEELRKRREDAGLTGAELAHRMGFTPVTVSRMEHATRHSSVVDVITYLGFLGNLWPGRTGPGGAVPRSRAQPRRALVRR